MNETGKINGSIKTYKQIIPSKGYISVIQTNINQKKGSGLRRTSLIAGFAASVKSSYTTTTFH